MFLFLLIFFPLLLGILLLSAVFAGVFLVGATRGLLKPPPCTRTPQVYDEWED